MAESHVADPAHSVKNVDNTSMKKKLRINVRFWYAMEAATLVILAVIVWGMFSLPAVFYFGQQSDDKKTSSINATCTPVQYVNNQSLCYPVLQQYKRCSPALNQTSSLYISSNVNVQGSESNILQLLKLKNSLSSNCQLAILPFICLYLFPLCGENHTEYLPSFKECNSISNYYCKVEWQMAQQLSNSVPNCASLPDVSSDCNSSPVLPVAPITNLRNFTCRQNFILIGNYCLPACPNWTLRSNTAIADDIVVIIAAVIGLISGILFFLVSCLRYERMFVFPSILVVYQTPIILLLVIVTIINFISPKALYCTAPDWIATLKHPSTFCAFSGAVLVWCLMQIAVIWICHICIIFWTVMCPFHYMMFNSKKNQMRYIHMVVVIIAIVIPATSVAVMFGTGGFINVRFPPLLCFPRNADAGFYALLLPISLITPSGVSLLLAVFFTTHTRHRSQRVQQSKNYTPLGSVEKKILIVFCYYLLLGIMTVACIELNATANKSLIKSVSLYFGCESTAQENCDTYRRDALKSTYHEVTDTAYVLVALFPLINLIYAFNFNFGKWMNLCCTKGRRNGFATDMTLSAVETKS